MEDFVDIVDMADLHTLPVDTYFRELETNPNAGKYLPLPDGLPFWKSARYHEGKVLFGVVNEDLFLIADSKNFGAALFMHNRTVLNPGQWVYTPDAKHSVRKLKILEETQMKLDDLARFGQGNGMQEMQLASAPANAAGNSQVGFPSGSGMTRDAMTSQIRNEAVTRGFVRGYILATAPAVTMSLSRSTKNNATTWAIKARESRPSRPLAVLVAMPSRCVCRGDILTTPSDIMNNLVDFENGDPNDMIYQALPVNAATMYIGALGGRLPEYAPAVNPGSTKQWTPAEILSGNPEVTFVYAKPIVNTARNAQNSDALRFALKSSSERRSLYTPSNVMCLRALKHRSTAIKSQKDAMEVNECAFGGWRYTDVKVGDGDSKEKEKVLARAQRVCPSNIWETDYEIDGKKTAGIGSCFFMLGNSATSANNETVPKFDATYWPWYQTGKLREVDNAAPVPVDKIVERTHQAAEGDKKERMVTTSILWRDNPKDKAFQSFDSFANSIINGGYITRDKLNTLGVRSSGKAKKGYQLSNDAMTALSNFMKSEATAAEISAVLDEASVRRTLAQTQR